MDEDAVVTDLGVPAAGTPAEAIDLGYTITTESFSGPLDLLLFLVRRTEVDIFDIPLVTVIDQFVTTVTAWRDMDLEVAGDFIAMAATLLEIKARLVAPPPDSDEPATEEADLFDPRADLINALLAYRRFKEAAQELTALETAATGRVHRQYREAIPEDPDDTPELELGEIDAHLLMRCCETILARINGLGPRTVPIDDMPLTARIAALIELMRERQRTTMRELLEREQATVARLGVVLATLECTRQRFVELRQFEQYGNVDLRWRDDEERTRTPALPPEEEVPAGKRRRRPPLVTWIPPPRAADTPEDVDDDGPDEPVEGDEQRFLRELDQLCDLNRVLDTTQDVEKSFLAHWYELHPELKPPEPTPPEPPPPPPTPEPTPRRTRPKPVTTTDAVSLPTDDRDQTPTAEVPIPTETTSTVPAVPPTEAVVTAENVTTDIVPALAVVHDQTLALEGPSLAEAAPTVPSTEIVITSGNIADSATEAVPSARETILDVQAVPDRDHGPAIDNVIPTIPESARPVEAQAESAKNLEKLGVVAVPCPSEPVAVSTAIPPEESPAPSIAPESSGPSSDPGHATEDIPRTQTEPIAESVIASIHAEVPAPSTPIPSFVTSTDSPVAIPEMPPEREPDLANETVAPSVESPIETAFSKDAALDRLDDDEEDEDSERLSSSHDRSDDDTDRDRRDRRDRRDASLADVEDVNAALLAADDTPPPRFVEQGPASDSPAGLSAAEYLAALDTDPLPTRAEPVSVPVIAEQVPSATTSAAATVDNDVPATVIPTAVDRLVIPPTVVINVPAAVPHATATPIVNVEPAVTETPDAEVVPVTADIPVIVATSAPEIRATSTVIVEPIAAPQSHDRESVSTETTVDAAYDDVPIGTDQIPEPVAECVDITVDSAISASPTTDNESPASSASLVEMDRVVADDVPPPVSAPAIEPDHATAAAVPAIISDTSESVVTCDETTVDPGVSTVASTDDATVPVVIPVSATETIPHIDAVPPAEGAPPLRQEPSQSRLVVLLADTNQPLTPTSLIPASVPPPESRVVDPPPEPPPPDPASASTTDPVFFNQPTNEPATDLDDDMKATLKLKIWRRAAILVAALFFAGLVLVWYTWIRRDVLEVIAAPVGDNAIDGHSPLSWRFNLDVVPVSGPVRPLPTPVITPTVDGAWSWTDQRTLTFTPALPMPQATVFTVRLDPNRLISAEGFRCPAGIATTVHTPALAAQSCQVTGFAADGTTTVAITFNHAVNAATVASRVTFEHDGQALSPTPVDATPNTTVSLRVNGIGAATITLPAGMTGCVGTLGLATAWASSVRLGPPLHVTSIDATMPGRGPGTVRLSTDGDDLSLLADAIAITPAVACTPRICKQTLELTGDFVPGTEYQVTVRALWPADHPGSALAVFPASVTLPVTMPHRAPSIWLNPDHEHASALIITVVNTGTLVATIRRDGSDEVIASIPVPALSIANDQVGSAHVDTQALLYGLPAGSYRLHISDGTTTALATVDKLVVPAERIMATLQEWNSTALASRHAGQAGPCVCVVVSTP